MNIKSIATLVTLISLAACQTTSDFFDEVIEPPEPPASLASLQNDVDNLAFINTGVTPTSQVPAGGSATYDGFLYAAQYANNGRQISFFLGDMTLDVDFSRQSIEGGVDDFYQLPSNVLSFTDIANAPGTAVAGELFYNSSDNSIEGRIFDVTDTPSSYDVGLDSLDFRGSRAQLLEGYGFEPSGSVRNGVFFDAETGFIVQR